MPFVSLPQIVAWRHCEARDGFEVAFFEATASDLRFLGHTAAVEDGQAWSVRYDITVDQNWRTRRAQVWALSAAGEDEVTLETDGSGHWRVNGSMRPDLDGCLDVDLESSACTNTIPVHRLGLGIGHGAEAPATYVRALDLAVARLEQHYLRVNDEGLHQRYDYSAPVFNFECRLIYDESGLVLEYPGIASRVQ